MSAIQTMTRVFKMNSVELPDPDPDKPPEQAILCLVSAFPHLQHCTLGVPTTEADRLIYPVIKPPVKTNGGV